MGGERLPLPLNFNTSSLSETSGSNQIRGEERMVADGSTLNGKGGHTGKGGKMRISSPAFRKKPYDRPVQPGGLGINSCLNGHTPSLRSRFVDSASNLIVSSASYLFESFFKRRRTLWIDDGTLSAVRMNSADMDHKECSKPPSDILGEANVSELQRPGEEVCCEKTEGEDSDLAKVEGILKQKSFSREEVKRLTDVLQYQASTGHVAGSSLEAYTWPENTQQVGGKEPNPVQLAKAYMGEHASRFAGMPSRRQSTPYRYGEGAGPSSVKRIKEVANKMSPIKASRSGLVSAERMLKRRLIADDDDKVISKGPIRRVRQKMTIMPNSSPYIRQLTVGSGLRTSSKPLGQFKERIEKADEALEMSKLPAMEISVEKPAVVATCNVEDHAKASKAREISESLSKNDSPVLPTSNDVDKFNCTPAVEPVVPIASNAGESSTTGSPAASAPQLTAVSESSKGFHMSAFFEDSSSDEESSPAVKSPFSTEAQQLGSSISSGALEEKTQKPPLVGLVNNGSFSSVPESTSKASSILLQPSNVIGPSNAAFSGSPPAFTAATKSSESTPLSNFKPLPVFTFTTSAAEREFLPSTPSVSARAASSVVLSTPPVSASSLELATLPAPFSSFSVQAAAPAALLPSSSSTEVEKPSLMQNTMAAEAVGGEKSGFSPVTASALPKVRFTETPSLVAPTFTAPASMSESSVALVTTAASVSPVRSEPSSAGLPLSGPVVFQASSGGAQVDTVAAPGSLFKAGGEIAFTSGSPGSDRQAEADTMATDPMTEEPDSSFVSSSPSPFLFGLASSASVPSGQMPSFGSNASSASSFSFPAPSSGPSGASSSALFPFSSPASGASGQLFTFGSSVTPASNLFSVNTQSSFSFGSSAASSTSPLFTTSSSAPATFPATPAPPSFQFGPSSSSTSSTSMFGAQMTEPAGAFASPGSQNNSSAFVFPPMSSGTPSPPFQFGGAGSSGPSFGAQTFMFGGQPAPTASNPFAQSGTPNAAPFQFGASSATPSQSVFPSGNTTPSPPFGAQQPSGSPFSFTFGAQAGASAAGQPFSFGGQQPAASAQNPFTLPGAASQNAFPSAGASGMDFGGGFSLGAAGSEKSGRKFIKAKRIGGGKRGK